MTTTTKTTRKADNLAPDVLAWYVRRALEFWRMNSPRAPGPPRLPVIRGLSPAASKVMEKANELDDAYQRERDREKSAKAELEHYRKVERSAEVTEAHDAGKPIPPDRQGNIEAVLAEATRLKVEYRRLGWSRIEQIDGYLSDVPRAVLAIDAELRQKVAGHAESIREMIEELSKSRADFGLVEWARRAGPVLPMERVSEPEAILGHALTVIEEWLDTEWTPDFDY